MVGPTKSKKLPNLLIGALNCHGLLEKLDDPNVIDLIRQNDILGTSETWLKEKDVVKVPGYNFYPLHRKGGKGPTRGGNGFFIKEGIKKHVKLRYDLSCENALWCKLDKKYFGFDEDVYIGSIYFPPEQSTREKRLKTDPFKQLKETITKIDGKYTILVGDFNARTHILEDTLKKEKHEEIIAQDFYSKIQTKRNNTDKIINNYGKKSLITVYRQGLILQMEEHLVI